MFRSRRYDMNVCFMGFIGLECEGFMFETTRKFEVVKSAILFSYFFEFAIQWLVKM